MYGGIKNYKGLADVGDGDDVGEDTGGGDVGTGAVAFDDHGVFVVSFGGDHDDVVGAFEFEEGVSGIDFLESEGAVAVVHGGDEAEAFI